MKNKLKRFAGKIGIVSKLMYIASAILAVISIALAGSITYDSMYYSEKVKGYTMEYLDSDFSSGNYGSLCRKVAYNRACGRDISDSEEDYYAFADFYESIISYNVYLKNGNLTKADEELALSNEYLSQIQHKIFKEKAEKLKESIAVN
jgi:hypothetical protein